MKTFGLVFKKRSLTLTCWMVALTNLGLSSPALSAPPNKKARIENTSLALSSNPTLAEGLPSDVLNQILSYLGSEEIAQCQGVNSKWKECIQNSPVSKVTLDSARELITLLRTHQGDPILRNLLASITYRLSGTNLGKVGARNSRASHSLNRLFHEILDQAIAKSIPNFRQIPGLIAANEAIDPQLADRLFRFACDCQDPPVQYFTFLGLASNPSVSSEILTEIRSYLTPEKLNSVVEPWLDVLDANETPAISHHIFSEAFEAAPHAPLQLAPFVDLLPQAEDNEEDDEGLVDLNPFTLIDHIEELKLFIFAALIENPKYQDPQLITTALSEAEEFEFEPTLSVLFNAIASSRTVRGSEFRTLIDLSRNLANASFRSQIILLALHNPAVPPQIRKNLYASLKLPFVLSSFLNAKVLRGLSFQEAKNLYNKAQNYPDVFSKTRNPLEIQIAATVTRDSDRSFYRSLSENPRCFINLSIGRALNTRPIKGNKRQADQLIQIASRHFGPARLTALLTILPRNPGFPAGSLPTVFQTAQNLALPERAEVLSGLASSSSKGKIEKSPLLTFIERCRNFD